MGILDGIFGSIVKEVIDLVGTPGTLITQTVVADLENGGSATTTVNTPVSYTPPQSYGTSLINGTTILYTDLQTTIPAVGLETPPSPANSFFQVGNIVYRIITATPVYTGADIVSYDLQLRI